MVPFEAPKVAHQRPSDRPESESANDTTLSKWYRDLGIHCLDTKEQLFNILLSSASWSMIKSVNSRNAKDRRSGLGSASDWSMWGGGKLEAALRPNFAFINGRHSHCGQASLKKGNTRETTKEARLDNLLNNATS